VESFWYGLSSASGAKKTINNKTKGRLGKLNVLSLGFMT